jgi:homoaconitase/3-isopropylmalate dehydratase large subunit
VEVVLAETTQVQQEQMVVLLVDLVVVEQFTSVVALEVLEQLKEEILAGLDLIVQEVLAAVEQEQQDLMVDLVVVEMVGMDIQIVF